MYSILGHYSLSLQARRGNRLRPNVLQPATLCVAGLAIDWARCCTDRFKRSVLPFKVTAYDCLRYLLRLTMLATARYTHYSLYSL